MNPQISVITTTYNAAKYIRESINSILAQTFTDFEFIIIDDASTDNTPDVVKNFTDKRIIFIQNKENIGAYASANKGLEIAKGKYVARLDADDVADKDRLKIQYEFLEQNGEYEVVGSNIILINSIGERVGERVYPETDEDNLGNIFFANTIPHSSAMYRRAFVNKVGNYSTEYNKSQDYDLWLKIIEHGGKLHNLQKFLVYYRIHDTSITFNFSHKQEEIAQYILRKRLKTILNVDLSKRDIKLLRNAKGRKLNFLQNKYLLYLLVKLNRAFFQRFKDQKRAQDMFLSNSADLIVNSKIRNQFVKFIKEEFNK